MKTCNAAFIFCFTFFGLGLMPCASDAFKQGDLDRLLTTGECQWCDLRNADISGAHLPNAELSESNLSGAKLAGANLTGANLSGAYLSRSDLSGADLSTAFLRKANMNGANLTGANLTGADLSGAVWTDGSKCANGSVKECKSSITPAAKDDVPSLFPFDF